MHQFNDGVLDFPYAALRIHGYIRQTSTTAGDVVYGLAARGPAVFEFDPTGRGGDGLAPLLRHNTLTPALSGAVPQNQWAMHAVSLTYLPSDPQHPSVSLTWQTPKDDAQVTPADNQLLFWYDKFKELAPLTTSQCWTVDMMASDSDTDSDGLCDWEELALGLSPIDATTFGDPDVKTATTLLNAPNVVSIEQPASTMLTEESQNSITVTVRRLSGGGAFSLPLTVGGDSEASDLILTPTEVNFLADQTEATITVRARDDSRLEPTELAQLTLGSTASASVSGINYVPFVIQDEPDPQPILYVARYAPQGTAVTPAYGYASILLAADRNTAWVASDFNNLTTPQTTAHIHLEDDGSIIEGLPAGTYSDYLWDLTTPANMNMPGMNMADGNHQFRLDALDQNRLYANVHSQTYPAGEIKGTFLRAEGAFEFDPPPPLPADPGTPNPTEIDAFRFLEQATFGPTTTTVSNVVALGIDAWIDAQIARPMSSSLEYQLAADGYDDALSGKTFSKAAGDHRRNLVSGWFTRAIHGKDQLRQRMAFALSEIFIISLEDASLRNRTYGVGHYQDMLASHAFGNFRDLLEDVSRHPCMGIYLSSLKNEKENPVLGTKPDENYAREIMQLFTIGLLERHPDGTLRYDELGNLIPTYTNDDITELSRVFTGLSFGRKHNSTLPNQENTKFYYGGGPGTNQVAYLHPMKMFADYHDTGAKTILKNVPIPADLDPDEELDLALDALFNHPNTPPFIARLLIQRLVTSNPSRGYVYRVAQAFEDNGVGIRGDLAAVTKAIFLDQEARSPSFYTQDNYGKLKEPLIAYIQVCRATGVSNNIPLSVLANTNLDVSVYETNALRYAWADSNSRFSQTPYSPPTVFNWFLPDFIPGGALKQAQLYGPEFQIATDSGIMTWLNNFNSTAWYSAGGGLSTGNLVNFDREDDDVYLTLRHLDTLEQPQLVNWYNTHLRGGRMTPFLQTQLNQLNVLTYRRVEGTLTLLLNSPEFMIQR